MVVQACGALIHYSPFGRTAGRGTQYYAMYVPGHSFGRIRLGDRLRALREAAGIPREDAALAIKKRNADSVRHFESGARLIPPLELDVLGKLYGRVLAERGLGSSEAVIAELEELYAHASKPGEFASFGLPEGIITYLDLERAASTVRTFQNLVIPGMLQVEPCMRRLFQLVKIEANVIDQRVRARLKRQERLHPSKDAADPVQLTAVIAEEALLRCAREPDVGPAQLAHLIEVAGQANVEIHVMDLDAKMHAGMGGSFTYLTLPDEVDDFVYQETSSGGQLTDLPATVRHLDTLFNELRDQALDPNKSLALIARLARQLK